MSQEKQSFTFRFLLRFLGISFFTCAAYVIHGGRFGIVLHVAPTALMVSFVGLFFLLSNGRFPQDWTSREEVLEFRTMAWRVMWALNIFIFFSNAVITLGRLSEGTEAIGSSVASSLAGVVINSLFYLALITSPRLDQNSPLDSQAALSKKKKALKFLSGGMFWTGILVWFGIGVSLVGAGSEKIFYAESVKEREIKNQAYDLAWKRVDQLEEEYIAKNCKRMDQEEIHRIQSEFEKEEIQKLKSAGGAPGEK